MNIGEYTFSEFCSLAEKFHGYAAPGVLVGGFMVEKAKKALPEGTLFEAVVESAKCLPDAVQLLTLCSIGNQRLKILDLGRYAVNLFDKHGGAGFRASLNARKMRRWPELYAWFFKKKPKAEQDAEKLEREIEEAGDSYCDLAPIIIKPRFIGHGHSSGIALCPQCGEAYPFEDGDICRGCQGESPFSIPASPALDVDASPPVRIMPVEEAIGKIVVHDMTRIEPGKFKGAEFKKGQKISVGDLCRLQSMGRFNIAVEAGADAPKSSGIHENQCAEAFAEKMAGPGIKYDLPPKEGKIDFLAARDGLFLADRKSLLAFNLVPQVMVACIQDCTRVKKDSRVAGVRAIPLYLPENLYEQALNALDGEALFQVKPFRKANIGILVTGTEVFQGLIEDKFIPVISSKAAEYDCPIIKTVVAPDDKKAITAAVEEMKAAGVDLLVTTGGLSVDPDDVTRQALLECGLTGIVHGMPVLPGAMSLTGEIKTGDGSIDVIGVPACALYYKTTFLDLILPRILAGLKFTRQDAARLAEGGYCLGCKTCSWPHCGFGK